METVVQLKKQKVQSTLSASINEAIKNKEKTRFRISKGLRLEVTEKGKAEFIFRAQKHRLRSQIKLGTYKNDAMEEDVSHGLFSVETAKEEARKYHKKIANRINPSRGLRSLIGNIRVTFNDIFQRVLENKKRRVKSTAAFERHYINEISPFIGSWNIKQITQQDVEDILNRVLDSGRKSVTEKCLHLIKNVFDYAEANTICFNTTKKMTVKEHAGGKSIPTGIALAEHDLKKTFRLMRNNISTFHRRFYCAIILLAALGLRKCELIKSKWKDFDRDEQLLHIEREISKNKVAIAIPISEHLQPILDELWSSGNGSEFIFPAFKKSSNGHMCENTLNSALKRLFDLLERENRFERIQRFKVHDLRRTFRTMLRQMKVSNDIAELCINHRSGLDAGLSKDEHYDRYVKLDERWQAHEEIAEKIILLAGKYIEEDQALAA